MRLTLHTDYALRTLLYLGLHPGQRVRVEAIADAYRISGHHLDKVVQRLAKGGFIETHRGRGGGLLLALPPDRIRLGDVVRHTEEDLAVVICFATNGDPCGDTAGERCPLAGVCVLQNVLGQALAAFMRVLDGLSLADLLEGPARGAAAARLGLPVAEG
jgi:Rrf2 family nitric oxide-sensitive transcriptional repressor